MGKAVMERIAGVAEWLRGCCGASALMVIPGVGQVKVYANGEWERV